MAFVINFNMINVNTLDTNSSIAVGVINQNGWDSHAKNNFGNGMQFGINMIPANVNNIVDNDVIDSPITDPDVKPGFTNQSC